MNNQIVVLDDYNLKISFPSNQDERILLEHLEAKEREDLTQLLYEAITSYLGADDAQRECMSVIIH